MDGTRKIWNYYDAQFARLGARRFLDSLTSSANSLSLDSPIQMKETYNLISLNLIANKS